MFSGNLCALVTPMTHAGAIDYAALSKLVAEQLRQHSAGLVLLGTTGESPTVSAQEREAMIKQVVAEVAEQCPVIVGTGANCTKHTIEMTKQAMVLGADGVLLVTPYYNKPTQEGLFRHYQAVAKAVPIPQILYNVPSRTGCDLMPDTVKRLGQMPNIVALKEASGRLERLQELLAADCQLDILSGDDGTAAEFILAGAKGVISVAANVAPALMHQLADRALHQDTDQVAVLQAKLQPLFKALSVETNPIPTKWALHEMGLIAEGIRLPLTWLAEQYHASVARALRDAGLIA